MLDCRFLSSTLDGVGSILLRSKRTLADVKTKSCDNKYAAESTGTANAVVTKQQREVNDEYHNLRRQQKSTWSRARHQATRALSRDHSTNTAKRTE